MIEPKHLSNFVLEDGTWYMPDSSSYFDGYSSQFKTMRWKEKLENLAVLISSGMDLTEIVSTYIYSNSSTTLESLKNTLISYIQILRWDDSIHWSSELLDEFPSIELAQTLQEELRLRFLFDLNEVVFSHWDECVEEELIKRTEKSKDKLQDILSKTDFSKEFLYC